VREKAADTCKIWRIAKWAGKQQRAAAAGWFARNIEHRPVSHNVDVSGRNEPSIFFTADDNGVECVEALQFVLIGFDVLS